MSFVFIVCTPAGTACDPACLVLPDCMAQGTLLAVTTGTILEPFVASVTSVDLLNIAVLL